LVKIDHRVLSSSSPSRKFVALQESGMRARRRDALSVRLMRFFPPVRGWRAEKRKPLVSASVAGDGGRVPARQQALKQRSGSAIKKALKQAGGRQRT
jgi:hypothetical protein